MYKCCQGNLRHQTRDSWVMAEVNSQCIQEFVKFLKSKSKRHMLVTILMTTSEGVSPLTSWPMSMKDGKAVDMVLCQ